MQPRTAGIAEPCASRGKEYAPRWKTWNCFSPLRTLLYVYPPFRTDWPFREALLRGQSQLGANRHRNFFRMECLAFLLATTRGIMHNACIAIRYANNGGAGPGRNGGKSLSFWPHTVYGGRPQPLRPPSGARLPCVYANRPGKLKNTSAYGL